jgi:hypothetical protein
MPSNPHTVIKTVSPLQNSSDIKRTIDPDSLLDQTQVARILNTTEKFLEGRRYRGGGVPFIRVGRLVRYRRQDVLEFISNNLCHSTSEASAGR